MKVFVRKISKNSKPGVIGSVKKWYYVIKSIGFLRGRELALMVAEDSTIDPKEAELAVTRAGRFIVNALMSGQTVELEDLGSFRLTASCRGADTKEELTIDHIKRYHIRFTPFVVTKDKIKHTHAIDIETI